MLDKLLRSAYQRWVSYRICRGTGMGFWKSLARALGPQ